MSSPLKPKGSLNKLRPLSGIRPGKTLEMDDLELVDLDQADQEAGQNSERLYLNSTRTGSARRTLDELEKEIVRSFFELDSKIKG